SDGDDGDTTIVSKLASFCHYVAANRYSVDRTNAQGGRMSKEDTKHVSRREFLRLAGIGVGASVLAACAGQAPAAPTAAPGAAPTAAPAASAATAAPAAAAAPAAEGATAA